MGVLDKHAESSEFKLKTRKDCGYTLDMDWFE